MVTELLGALIFVGAVLVFVGRYYAQRRAKPEQDRKELVESTGRLKEELSRSADAVIARMGEHVEQLEAMLREADAKNAVFEALLREADESRKTLEMCLKDAQETAQQLREYQSEAARRAPLHLVERALHSPAATYEGGAAQDALRADSAMERQDAVEFAAVLQSSIERDAQETGERDRKEPIEETPSYAPQTSVQEEMRPIAAEGFPAPDTETEERAFEPSAAEPREATVADKARALLLSGVPVEEVSRQTGMGKGAVELVRELSRRQLAQ